MKETQQKIQRNRDLHAAITAASYVQSTIESNTYEPFSRQLLLVYFCAFLYLLRLACEFIPLIQKINYINTGDIDETSSGASFTYFTIVFLNSVMEFLVVKYNAALSDYAGRKVILIMSSIVFAIAHTMFALTESDSVFFLGAMLSATFQSGNIFTAWVCDLVSKDNRSKALGALVGISVGFGFVFGVPLGVGISSVYGFNASLYLAAILSLFAGVVVIFVPVNDTKSGELKMLMVHHGNIYNDYDNNDNEGYDDLKKKHDSMIASIDNDSDDNDNNNNNSNHDDNDNNNNNNNNSNHDDNNHESHDLRIELNELEIELSPDGDKESTSSLSSSPSQSQGPSNIIHTRNTIPATNTSFLCIRTTRRFPPDARKFLYEHHPFSGFHVIKEALYPWTWASFFFSFTTQQVLNSNFIQFANEIFNISTIVAGGFIALVGIAVVFFAPIMSTRYQDKPLFTLGAVSSMIGLFLLSAAGTSIDMRARSILGFMAALMLAFGGFWYSTLQTIITTQYVEHRQGEATGVLSQLAQLVNFLAYPTSLLFSYMISSEKKPFYWPGICFALAGVYHAISIALHVNSFGFTDTCHLLRREKNSTVTENGFFPRVDEADIGIMMTAGGAGDGTVEAASYEQERERQFKLRLQASPGLHAAL